MENLHLTGAALLACGLLACGGPGPRTVALETDLKRLRSEIDSLERNIADARRESESLEDQLYKQSNQLQEQLGSKIGGRDQLYLNMDAELVASLVRSLLDGYSDEEPGAADTPTLHWQLKGIRTRLHRGRVFVSGGYSARAGPAHCEGPVHGHLFYLERNLLKLSDMEVRCRLPTAELSVQVDERVPPIPLPFVVVESSPMIVKDGVSSPRSKLDIITPVEVTLGMGRIEVRTRAVTLRAATP